MIKEKAILGGGGKHLGPGWRKIIVTEGQYGAENGRWFTTGYTLGRDLYDGRYWTCPGSFLSDTKIDQWTIANIVSATYEDNNYNYRSVNFLVIKEAIPYDRNRKVYIKKGDKLFTLSMAYYPFQFHNILSESDSLPTTPNSEFLFMPEDRNKEIDIYIGFTPPPIRRLRKVLRKLFAFGGLSHAK